MGQLGTCAQVCAAIMVMVMAMFGLITPSSGAELLRLEYVSVRGGYTGNVIGQFQPESFNQFDLGLATRLPLEKEIGDNWVLGTRVLLTGGALVGTHHNTAAIFTLEPFYVLFGRKDGLISIDIGIGGALVTPYHFENQNFGGVFQWVWTFGATSRFLGPFGAGYHFQHFSDAGMYGSDARGVDMHLFELIYWFDTK